MNEPELAQNLSQRILEACFEKLGFSCKVKDGALKRNKHGSPLAYAQ